MQKLFRTIAFLWLLSFLLAPAAFANPFAQAIDAGKQLAQDDSAPKTGLSGASAVVADVAGEKGAGYTTEGADVVGIAGILVNTLLGLLGIIFVVLIIYAGYQWMTAQGAPEPVEKAKSTITNSIIGLIIVLGAWAIYGFVINILTT